ncbi:MAG TPA: DUF885 domain-containing protein [Myxococcales bacterium]|nr:DUF885 domain-containing protein [Myxococcales bacterium]
MTQTTLAQIGFAASAALSCLAACTSAPTKPEGGDESVAALADRYFEDVAFKYSPTRGTRAGFHQYDTRLEDFSRAAIDAQLAALKDYQRRIEALRPPASSADAAIDRDLLLSEVRSGILSLETLRFWEKDPDVYSGGITFSAFVIMSRSFASPDERLRSLIAREKQMPGALQAARANLKNPPRRYTEIALEQLPGIVGFFEKDVPAAFKDAKDEATLREFAQSNGQVIAALRSYQQFLRDDLLPRSGGDYRIGPDAYRQKLVSEEMVDVPLDRLLEIGFADLRRNQREFQRVASLLYPGQTAQEALAKLAADHPPPGELLQAFRATFDGLRDFIGSHHIVTIPSPVLPIVEETPPFMRALTFASMDTPGPYEQRAKEAYFNVTLPEANWTPAQVEEHMAGFNRGTVISTAVHEAYPGHYVQFLWVQHAPSKVRKLIGCGSNEEGWAHYTEQMMLEEGYGRTGGAAEEKDAKFLELRLGQLQDALLRNARYIVGIQMHTGSMTFDQGVEFFQKEGYQSHENALRETKRGTRDPTYLVYTLGKLQILKLRDDYRKKMGNGSTLQQFHDEFLKQGFPPVKIVRRTMLGDDSPTL